MKIFFSFAITLLINNVVFSQLTKVVDSAKKSIQEGSELDKAYVYSTLAISLSNTELKDRSTSFVTEIDNIISSSSDKKVKILATCSKLLALHSLKSIEPTKLGQELRQNIANMYLIDQTNEVELAIAFQSLMMLVGIDSIDKKELNANFDVALKYARFGAPNNISGYLIKLIATSYEGKDSVKYKEVLRYSDKNQALLPTGVIKSIQDFNALDPSKQRTDYPKILKIIETNKLDPQVKYSMYCAIGLSLLDIEPKLARELIGKSIDIVYEINDDIPGRLSGLALSLINRDNKLCEEIFNKAISENEKKSDKEFTYHTAQATIAKQIKQFDKGKGSKLQKAAEKYFLSDHFVELRLLPAYFRAKYILSLIEYYQN